LESITQKISHIGELLFLPILATAPLPQERAGVRFDVHTAIALGVYFTIAGYISWGDWSSFVICSAKGARNKRQANAKEYAHLAHYQCPAADKNH